MHPILILGEPNESPVAIKVIPKRPSTIQTSSILGTGAGVS